MNEFRLIIRQLEEKANTEKILSFLLPPLLSEFAAKNTHRLMLVTVNKYKTKAQI